MTRRNQAASTPPRTGCPCGCRTRLPWLDDPECIRHQPMPAPHNWHRYDTQLLGLAAHYRERCPHCQAVA